jgi:hypothetical protein
VADLVQVFRSQGSTIETRRLEKGLTSDEVLSVLRKDLVGLGFEVEAGKRKRDKIERPVFFGENGRLFRSASLSPGSRASSHTRR